MFLIVFLEILRCCNKTLCVFNNIKLIFNNKIIQGGTTVTRIAKKESGPRMCGIVAECLSHINQDALCFKEFTDENGETVYVGAISDGCSGALGSEHGSTFMVQTFIEEAGKLVKKYRRDSAIMRQTLLNLLERMTIYKPRRGDTGIEKLVDVESSEELSATLYGFIADSNIMLLALAGDGSISINDHHYGIGQENGDLYPEYILSFPRKTWEKRLDDIFVFGEFPTSKIRSLVLATDGFTHPLQNEYPGLVNDPAMYILHAEHHATIEGHGTNIPGSIPSRGGDDATALVFANLESISNNPIGAKEVENLAKKTSRHSTQKILREIKESPCVTVRESARKCNPNSDKTFQRNLSHRDGVHLFGITASDRTRYKKQQQKIIASRIVCEDALAALFGTPSNSSSTKTIYAPIKKKPADVVVVRKSVTPKADRVVAIKASTTVVAPKEYSGTKKPKEHAPKWRPFADLCSIAKSRRTGIGFRQFGQVMYDLWHFVNNCHLQGLRIGNLRPWDILYRVIPAHMDESGLKKTTTFEFSLANPDNPAMVGKGEKLIPNYSNLDPQYVHPEYFQRLSYDDQARLDQDWYAYSVLCYWFVTKFDPFGEGFVKAKPDADRIYRMEKVILSQSSKVEIDEKTRNFIDKAIGRLSQNILDFINAFTSRKNLLKKPTFLLAEFIDENIIICNNKTMKHGRQVVCGFKQLKGFNSCGYCMKLHVELIPSTA